MSKMYDPNPTLNAPTAPATVVHARRARKMEISLVVGGVSIPRKDAA